MKLVYNRFLGEMPLVDPMLLQLNNATRAWNTRLERGSIECLHKPKFYRESRKPRDQLSLYRFAPVPGDPESGWMFSWDRVVDVVPGPVAGNSQNLTYWTGEDYPRYTDNSIATGSAGPLPQHSYRLGVEQPNHGPHVELMYKPVPDPFDDGGNGNGDNGDNGGDLPEPDDAATEVDRDYVVTFIQQLGSLEMEGPPSDPSSIVTVPSSPPGFGVRVSNIATPPSGPFPWGSKRLYRRIYSAGQTQFALVTTLAVDEVEFEDTIPDAEIPGDLLISENYDPPPETMHSLGVLSNGIMFAANENDICLSEPYQPHAWNVFARYPVPHPIIGMGQADNQIIAITAKNPYICVGFNPANMSTQELHLEQGCLSKRSIVSGSFGCVYASPDGIVLISGQGSRVITQGLLTQKQWQALNPASMIGAVNEDLLLMTFQREDETRGTFIMDPGSPELGIRFTDQYFLSAYHDGLLDSLLVWDPVQKVISLWDEGDPLTYIWRGPLHVLPRLTTFTAARIEAYSYDNTIFKLIIDREVLFSKTILDNRTFRLPSGYQAQNVQIEVEGSDTIQQISIAEAPHELE